MLSPTFELVSGDGDEDNDSFHIHGDQLQSEASFDYEENNRYSIRVKGTDIGGLSIEKKFTINVTDGPDAPTGILLGNSTVDENLKKEKSSATLVQSMKTLEKSTPLSW